MIALLMSVASALPCDAEPLTLLLLPPVEQAATTLGRPASDAAALVALDVEGLIERCAASRDATRAMTERVLDPAAVSDRATMFLLAGHPSTWEASVQVPVDTATVQMPQALSLVWTGADASLSLDLLGTERVQIAVRRGLPLPPPEPPENRRERRTWVPPTPPTVVATTPDLPLWTASCWGPERVRPLMEAMCGSISATPAADWVATALPATPFAVTGPPNPRVDDYRTLVWPDEGITARLWVYLDGEEATAHASQSALHAWAPGSDTVLLTCTADMPGAESAAQRVCDSLAPADDAAQERLRRLDLRQDQALDGVVAERHD